MPPIFPFRPQTSVIVPGVDSRRNARRRSPGVLVRAKTFDFSPALLKPPGRVVESDSLSSDVRRRAMDAVDSFGGRLTMVDVASMAGLNLSEAQRALQALASDTDGFLEVSNEGDVFYVFPSDYRSKLTAKSVRMKLEPLFGKTKSAAGYLFRFTFGTALIASIVLVFLAIYVLNLSMKSKDGDDDDDRGKSKKSSSTFNFSKDGDDDDRRKSKKSSSTFNSTSINFSWGANPPRKRRDGEGSEGTNFFESVFSFVFGDGDPNQGIEEERWKLIGNYVSSNGGVVTSEELAPYLDVETSKDQMNDESYVLPVLLRFGGQPEVDEEGYILYRFPLLQRTASYERRGSMEYVGREWSQWVGGVDNIFKEKKWQLSKTNMWQKAMVIGLGALNLFGVLILGEMLKETAVAPNEFITFISDIFPLLQIYAGFFFAMPIIRWFFICNTNAKIEKRNQAREQFARRLESPDLFLSYKLLSARDMAQKSFIGQDQNYLY